MTINWSFPRQVAVGIVAVWALALYPLLRFGSGEVLQAAVAGTVLAAANVLCGFAAIEYSFGKSTTTFLKFVLGGMGIRMLLLASVLVVFIKLFGYHTAALVCSLGVFYVVFLALEVHFIQKKLSLKHQ